jgi:tetratricopeptide (TPR) repeat protein
MGTTSMNLRQHEPEISHSDTAISLNRQAEIYYDQGKYAEVESLLRQALAINELEMGAIHPETVASLNNLGMFYYGQEKYTEKEHLQKRYDRSNIFEFLKGLRRLQALQANDQEERRGDALFRI